MATPCATLTPTAPVQQPTTSSTGPVNYTAVSATGGGGISMADQRLGKWDGDFWVEPTGYKVHRKWAEKYPALYGPLAQDPDEGQGEIECDDVISRLLAKFTGYGGTFSTWTERHAFIIFSGIGYNDVNSKDDVPPIPVFFLKEMAYCYTGLSMGRGAKKVEEAAPSLKTYAAIFAAGGVSITGLLKLIGIA